MIFLAYSHTFFKIYSLSFFWKVINNLGYVMCNVDITNFLCG